MEHHRSLQENNFAFQIENISINSSSWTTDSPKSTITFNFSPKNAFSLWILKQSQPEHVRTADLPLEKESILIDLDDFWSGDDGREDAHQVLDERLKRSWEEEAIPHNLRQQWIHMALDKALLVVKSMPTAHNNVSINFDVSMASSFLLDERLPILDQISLNFLVNFMQPQNKTVPDPVPDPDLVSDPDPDPDPDPDCCSICLIDFSGCSAFSTPCHHNFHRACLYKWLAINRRCPMCRANIPRRRFKRFRRSSLTA